MRKAWAEKTSTKKANEKGEAKPKDLVIRYLGADTTPAAFLGRLYAAERAGHEAPSDFPNFCCYSQVSEIEDLYNFCSRQRTQVTQMIRHSFDRDTISSERWTANAANFKTVLRWNWCAASTFEGGRRFFANSLTDGTTSRVDFAVLLPPSNDFDFRYGTYDDAYADELKQYINRLKTDFCKNTAYLRFDSRKRNKRNERNERNNNIHTLDGIYTVERLCDNYPRELSKCDLSMLMRNISKFLSKFVAVFK